MRAQAGGCLVGIDIGTGSCKVAAYDLSGRVVAEASQQYPMARPHAGWAEQDAMDYWTAAVACLRGVQAGVAARGGRVLGIGTCGQTPTIVLVGADGSPVRPAITWQDTRALDESAELRSRLSADDVLRTLGMAVPLEPTYPPAQLLWLSRHDPDAVRAAAVILQPKDFVNLKLTGEAASDPWDSKGVVNAKTGLPDPAYLALLGIPSALAPRCLGAAEVLGGVTPEVSTLVDVPEGVPVTTGWSDALCSVLGSGSLRDPAAAFDVSGTSEIVGVLATSRPPARSRLLVAPFLEPGWELVYGPTQTSGDAVRWFGDLTIGGAGRGVSASRVERLAGRAAGGSRAVFVPYLLGERAPIWNTLARGAFLGLSRADGTAELARAVLEGVAFSVRHVLDTAVEITGKAVSQVYLSGGGSSGGLAVQVRADVLGVPVTVPTRREAATLGAAVLAGLAVGAFASPAQAVAAMVGIERVVLPRPGEALALQEKYEAYRTYADSMTPH